MSIKSEIQFISIGCNTIFNCCDWSSSKSSKSSKDDEGDEGDDLFAYCSNMFISIYCPKKNQIMDTLKGHEKRVNCVKFLNKRNGKGMELISGSNDCRIIQWVREKEKEKGDGKGWKIKNVLKGHKGSVNCIDWIGDGDGDDEEEEMIVSSSVEKEIICWKEGKMYQMINCKVLIECMKIAYLPKTKIPMIAFGGTDSKIHVYVMKENGLFENVFEIPGHEDWVRCMEFCSLKDNKELFLATGSNDDKIRVWRINEKELKEKEENKSSRETFTNPIVLTLKERKWTFILETIIKGHNDWISTVKWKKNSVNEYKDLQLLSSSMDRTLMIWTPKIDLNNLWTSDSTMGGLGGLTGLFSMYGIYGAYFNSEGNKIIAQCFNGSLHSWRLQDGKWKSHYCLSGHNRGVTDIEWNPTGEYFLSCSRDKTTRLFSNWKKEDLWFEFGRPQIHGYEVNKISFIKNLEHAFVSGGDEKTLRVYLAPQVVIKSLKNVSNINTSQEVIRPIGAVLPTLSLSNKGINKIDKNNPVLSEIEFTEIIFDKPPLETHLLESTLWVESNQLFGHINGISSLACSNTNCIIASSCEAKKKTESEIRLWDTNTWEQIDVLNTGGLTVNQLAFSPSDKYLLAVTRDRNILVFKLKGDNNKERKYVLFEKKESHKKTIRDCSWSYDEKYFITCSRDKTIMIWSIGKESIILEFEIKFKIPVSSVEISPKVKFSEYLTAIGLENGDIYLIDKEVNDSKWKIIHEIDKTKSHCEKVNKLRWRMKNDHLELISCSDDTSIRLTKVSNVPLIDQNHTTFHF